jgi:hemoglobin-like flavoprotein
MISLSISLLDNKPKFEETMVKLADAHNKRGVRANEYGIVGEVLFYTVKRCIGAAYTPEVHYAWVKVFSRMLKYIVPKAVVFELHEGQAQIDRLNTLNENLKKELEDFKLTTTNTTTNE